MCTRQYINDDYTNAMLSVSGAFIDENERIIRHQRYRYRYQ